MLKIIQQREVKRVQSKRQTDSRGFKGGLSAIKKPCHNIC